jgi:hypothetical protein
MKKVIDNVTIITNNHKHPLLYFWELSEYWQKKAKKEYDWALEKSKDPYDCEYRFFVYRNWLYILDDFERVEHDRLPTQSFLQEYDAYSSDSFFSGVMIKFPIEDWGETDTDNLLCATFYS